MAEQTAQPGNPDNVYDVARQALAVEHQAWQAYLAVDADDVEAYRQARSTWHAASFDRAVAVGKVTGLTGAITVPVTPSSWSPPPCAPAIGDLVHHVNDTASQFWKVYRVWTDVRRDCLAVAVNDLRGVRSAFPAHQAVIIRAGA